MVFKKGNTPWNKELTKETDERVRKSSKKQSEIRTKLLKEGKIQVWNKGLTINDERVKNNLNSLGKFKGEERKDKTYKELYGDEKSNEIKKKMGKTQSKIKLGKNNPMYGVRGEEHPRFGTTPSFNTRKKQSAIYQGILIDEWKKFISKEPYDQNWTPKFRRFIRKRDNQICLKCGIHREKLNESLSVHHINYNKKLTIPQNCCSICRKCNAEVNYNRPHWTKFFQSLLSERYGYQYSENKEIVLDLKLN